VRQEIRREGSSSKRWCISTCWKFQRPGEAAHQIATFQGSVSLKLYGASCIRDVLAINLMNSFVDSCFTATHEPRTRWRMNKQTDRQKLMSHNARLIRWQHITVSLKTDYKVKKFS
jgi:hypothetical protein